ncbi:uncharacterized protein M6B38_265250 [Iris pallida]|uniref:RNase H type-1 domain-containing protein n=1 Tax=Iris pallida TaxID=29817 RepID=A0AAX6IDL2_IRIPA|nr:uncharacterized protein M6B38_265250 [Iris pallida]
MITCEDGWSSPAHGQIKINVDGASSSTKIAASAIARDANGCFIKAITCCSPIQNFTDISLQAEFLAMQLGHQLAKDMHGSDIIMEGDSLIWSKFAMVTPL